MQTAKHLSITGRVQGVGYRAWFAGQARQAGLSGWVRNRSDGSVEAVIAGDADTIGRFLAACWQGPPASRVDAIGVTDTPVPGIEGFRRRETL